MTGFVSRLQNMSIPLAMKSSTQCQWGLLHGTFEDRAQRGTSFILDWHNGGNHNANACSSVVCASCSAKLVIQHAGLPAKNGLKQDAAMQAYVDFHLVNFLFRS